jgi:HD-GYP domain-containing protein (c-di-GMP phosphodiesterase class II)
MKRPSPGVLSYILALTGLFGLTVGLLSRLDNPNGLGGLDVLFWAAMLLWSNFLEVKLPINARISYFAIFALTTVMLFPPWVAPLLAALTHIGWGKSTVHWYKDLFNRAQIGLSTALAAAVWYGIQNSDLIIQGLNFAPLVGIVAASVVYLLVNLSTVTYVIHLASGVSPRKVWLENFSWTFSSLLVLSPIALFMAKAYEVKLLGDWGGFSVLMVMVLLYFSRYYWQEKLRLKESFDSTIEMMVLTLDAKDPYTRLHSERVAAIAVDLAKSLGLDETDVHKIAYGARIHDIGKVGIPDSVLLKPGRLSEGEYAIVRSHPVRGWELLAPMHRYIGDVRPIIMYHHERWNGGGYPEGRRGEDIPLWARIVQIADSYEAMTAGRPYAAAKSPEQALWELERLAGKQFDPQLVGLFATLWWKEPLWRDRNAFLNSHGVALPFLSEPIPTAPITIQARVSRRM